MHSNLFHKSRLWCCSQRFNNPAFGEGEALLTHDWLPRWFSLEIVDMSQAFPLHPDTQLSIHIPPLEWSNKNRRSRCKSWTTGKHDKMLCRCCCPCCIVIVEVFCKFSDLSCTYFQNVFATICQKSWNIFTHFFWPLTMVWKMKQGNYNADFLFEVDLHATQGRGICVGFSNTK